MRSYSFVLAADYAEFTACGGPEPEGTDSGSEAPAPATPELPAMIVAGRGGFIPEGIEYDAASGRLLVGSLPEGTVYQLHGDGRLTAVATDPELVSSVGI